MINVIVNYNGAPILFGGTGESETTFWRVIPYKPSDRGKGNGESSTMICSSIPPNALIKGMRGEIYTIFP
jgi:hypothetical protein